MDVLTQEWKLIGGKLVKGPVEPFDADRVYKNLMEYKSPNRILVYLVGSKVFEQIRKA